MASIFIGIVICLDAALGVLTVVALKQDETNSKLLYYFILALMAMNIGLIIK